MNEKWSVIVLFMQKIKKPCIYVFRAAKVLPHFLAKCGRKTLFFLGHHSGLEFFLKIVKIYLIFEIHVTVEMRFRVSSDCVRCVSRPCVLLPSSGCVASFHNHYSSQQDWVWNDMEVFEDIVRSDSSEIIFIFIYN